MVWEYGSAVSAIVVERQYSDLDADGGGFPAGAPVQAVVVPATPDFLVQNDV